jgi:hypothetical protein
MSPRMTQPSASGMQLIGRQRQTSDDVDTNYMQTHRRNHQSAIVQLPPPTAAVERHVMSVISKDISIVPAAGPPAVAGRDNGSRRLYVLSDTG